MTQLVFIHGPGAGGCADGFLHQLEHFPGSLAPTLPGHLSGEPCTSVERYAEWVRGWLWAQGKHEGLVLSGFTMGASIALQYALDYPEEVKGLVLMTVAVRRKEWPPGALEMRLRAVEDPEVMQEWLKFQRDMLTFVEPELRERLMKRHEEVGPMSQYNDLVALGGFDARDRIGSLKPPLLLIRGVDDPVAPPEYELELHQAVLGSRFLRLPQAGHFPMAERPEEVNRAIEEFLKTLD